MKKIVINSDYEFLRSYIEKVPSDFDSLGTIMEARRNILREDKVDGIRLVIKSFRRIYLTNRVRYSFFYPSKAERAFEHAMILHHNGFHTPAPIAYIDVKRYGLITQSFFISEYIDFEPLQNINTLEPWIVSELIEALAQFTHRLHQNNIYHVDYTLGNILYKKKDGKYHFALVDNNRMHFGPISVEKGIKNLVRLGLPVEHLTWVAKEYAHLRKADEIVSIERLFHYKRNEVEARHMKQHLKNMLGSFKSLL